MAGNASMRVVLFSSVCHWRAIEWKDEGAGAEKGCSILDLGLGRKRIQLKPYDLPARDGGRSHSLSLWSWGRWRLLAGEQG